MSGMPAGNRLGTFGRLTLRGARRVPEVTAYFWAIKALSTAMGESTSDYLVHAMAPELAVALGFLGFVAALAIQFSRRRYVAWAYWLAVVGVGVFGTMAADVLHVGFGVPYAASSVLYGVVLAAVFVSWQRTEKTLSIHSIDTDRRELFYWAAVVATFAMGTAVGDLTAVTFSLGYLGSALLFAGVIAVPAVGYWRLQLEPDPVLLARLRGDPSARRLVRRLAGQAPVGRRTGLGGRSGGADPDLRDRLRGRLPDRQPA